MSASRRPIFRSARQAEQRRRHGAHTTTSAATFSHPSISVAFLYRSISAADFRPLVAICRHRRDRCGRLTRPGRPVSGRLHVILERWLDGRHWESARANPEEVAVNSWATAVRDCLGPVARALSDRGLPKHQREIVCRHRLRSLPGKAACRGSFGDVFHGPHAPCRVVHAQ